MLLIATITSIGTVIRCQCTHAILTQMGQVAGASDRSTLVHCLRPDTHTISTLTGRGGARAHHGRATWDVTCFLVLIQVWQSRCRAFRSVCHTSQRLSRAADRVVARALISGSSRADIADNAGSAETIRATIDIISFFFWVAWRKQRAIGWTGAAAFIEALIRESSRARDQSGALRQVRHPRAIGTWVSDDDSVGIREFSWQRRTVLHGRSTSRVCTTNGACRGADRSGGALCKILHTRESCSCLRAHEQRCSPRHTRRARGAWARDAARTIRATARSGRASNVSGAQIVVVHTFETWAFHLSTWACIGRRRIPRIGCPRGSVLRRRHTWQCRDGTHRRRILARAIRAHDGLSARALLTRRTVVDVPTARAIGATVRIARLNGALGRVDALGHIGHAGLIRAKNRERVRAASVGCAVGQTRNARTIRALAAIVGHRAGDGRNTVINAGNTARITATDGSRQGARRARGAQREARLARAIGATHTGRRAVKLG